MVLPHPEELDIGTSAPRPPEQAGAQVTAVVAGGDAQQPCVCVASRCDIEGVDFCVQALPQAIVGIAHHQCNLTHYAFSPFQAISPAHATRPPGPRWPSLVTSGAIAPNASLRATGPEDSC